MLFSRQRHLDNTIFSESRSERNIQSLTEIDKYLESTYINGTV